MRHLICAIAMLCSGLPAGASELSITNASFEDAAVPAGTFPIFTPAGWSLHDPNGLLDGALDAVGVLNPTGTTFFPGGAPDGSNVALVFLSGDVGLGEVGIEQAIDYTLRPDTTYTLSVMVGNIASGSGNPPITDFFNLAGFPGYAVQLLAGDTVVAEDRNSLAGSLAEGTFAESVVSLTVGAFHPNLDQALSIRLLNLNQPGTDVAPGIEVDFDAVSLTAVPAIPEPRTYALIAVGFVVLLIGARRRRSPMRNQVSG
jgi:hapalindole H/12-epi-hapalindole U/12-epi-fischerindole U synthase